MKYLSIKECCDRVGKSNSTIRRFIKEVKTNLDEIQNNYKVDVFRYEDLINNHQKIFVLETILLKYFNVEEEVEIKDTTSTINDNKTLEIFENQLLQKDNTINSLLRNQSEMIERQRELHILLKKSEERIQKLENSFNKEKTKFLIEDTDDIEEEIIKEEIIEDVVDKIVEVKEDNLFDGGKKRIQKLETFFNKKSKMNSNEQTINIDDEEQMTTSIDTLKDDKEKSFSDWINDLSK